MNLILYTLVVAALAFATGSWWAYTTGYLNGYADSYAGRPKRPSWFASWSDRKKGGARS